MVNLNIGAATLFIVFTVSSGAFSQDSKQSQEATRSPNVLRIWADPIDSSGAPSPDGDRISFVDWSKANNLAVRNLKTGSIRHLTNNENTSAFALYPIWSADGRQIAYTWFGETYELRLIRVDGGKPRVLFSEGYIQAYDWSDDGRHILVVRHYKDHSNHLLLVSTVDGSARTIRRLSWEWPVDASISPDGQYVVYDLPQDDQPNDRDIFIARINGDGESALVEHSGHDYGPLWSPDGKGIIFTSNRSGKPQLWALQVEKGLSVGEARQIPVDVTAAVPLGLTSDGTYFYSKGIPAGARNLKGDVYETRLDPNTAEPIANPKKLAGAFEGLNSRASYSPDGRFLAFLSPRGPVSTLFEMKAVVVRSLQDGSERILSPRVVMAETNPEWSPDGKTLLVCGRDDHERPGCFSVDLGTGVATPITPLHEPSHNYTVERAVWSPTGDGIYVCYRDKDKDNATTAVAFFDLRTSKQRLIYEVTTDTSYASYLGGLNSLAVSPNGTQLAFADQERLYIMPTAASHPVQEPNTIFEPEEGKQIAREGGLAWSADGKWIACVTKGSDASVKQQLWRVPSKGGEPRSTSLSAERLRHITLSRDGSKFAFTADASGVGHLSLGIWNLKEFLPSWTDADGLE